MGRIMAIDYGRKRCGVAVTDPLRIVANGLTNVPAHELMAFIQNYVKTEQVDVIVVGEPKDMKKQRLGVGEVHRTVRETARKNFPGH